MKIAVSGKRLGRALPSTLNSSINYFRPVSVKKEEQVTLCNLLDPFFLSLGEVKGQAARD